MKLTNPAQRLRIFIGEQDKWKGQPLYHALVLKAREMNMAGATVIRCIEGFGRNSRIKTARVLALSSDLPIVVEIVDNVEYIQSFLPVVKEMVKEGLVTLEDVEVIHYGCSDREEQD
ncbi:DUF190 domain-containing protein [Calderihabitans maritimus]|uniref:Uncharacterized protein n=1 Tax=Calderihabitans maritimus TaxID=1246530 RepID=A0A1Z5HQQ9_9FIRM|nr:DUF190 domain-containing protein [Calderihabitans maritimus]GAW91859.1 hypothetical protein KKC1_10200 [Calderihabitans maritimus]